MLLMAHVHIGKQKLMCEDKNGAEVYLFVQDSSDIRMTLFAVWQAAAVSDTNQILNSKGKLSVCSSCVQLDELMRLQPTSLVRQQDLHKIGIIFAFDLSQLCPKLSTSADATRPSRPWSR